ncbi:MAG: bifunctional 5,10-methylenetetrahydrofolate dehydrogenase/5,10-methenyltetrahydrofolate cyclohydrolase [Chloroflexota bacterium]|nr:bifunctional 5,10-methylenetetrahydrofolate dehydrogenase/5,10-methenyltetrahydrofolate cyclohydrolase [Chloroflexota bacterium]
MPLILDGRSVAATLREELRAGVREFQQQYSSPPRLDVVQVHGDAASDWYVRAISRACQHVGITFQLAQLPADIEQDALIAQIQQLNARPETHGIIVQVPLPQHLDGAAVIDALDPRKDVDGLHPVNLGRLAQGLPALVPNTPAGGMELLRHYNISLAGKHAVVVGRSNIVGKPMALLLLQEHATVTVAHSRTPNLAAIVGSADVVAVAVGRAGIVTGAMLKPGAVVVDFGINEMGAGQVVGDVDYGSAAEVAGAITPVPGGTGPVTNMMLLRNVLHAARAQQL